MVSVNKLDLVPLTGANKKPVTCRVCRVRLQPGQGNPYRHQGTPYRLGAKYYLCDTCHSKRAQILADRPVVRDNMELLAHWVQAALEDPRQARHQVDRLAHLLHLCQEDARDVSMAWVFEIPDQVKPGQIYVKARAAALKISPVYRAHFLGTYGQAELEKWENV